MKVIRLIPLFAVATLALGACSKSTPPKTPSAAPAASASAQGAPASTDGQRADHPGPDATDPSMTSDTIVNHAK